MYRHHFATRRHEALEPGTDRPALEVAQPLDLASWRLLLHQHVDDLHSRGADDDVLAPIEAQLRLYGETVGELVDHVDGQRTQVRGTQQEGIVVARRHRLLG